MPTLFVDQLTIIDCAVLDAERGLVGASWIVDIELHGELDEQGMVFDFGHVKRRLRDAIEAVADHRLLVPARHPSLRVESGGGDLILQFDSKRGRIHHRSPAAAVTLLPAERIDESVLGNALQAAASDAVPGNVDGVDIALRPEHIDGASYCYVHGLRKHDGLCQRIAHGHRSRVEIEIDGLRSEPVERQWAERWRDIYLGSRDDLHDETDDRLLFAYAAGEGEFELELPRAHCELLATESTVEQIADHIAAQVAAEHPGRSVRVRAFEGVDKGAIATREAAAAE